MHEVEAMAMRLAIAQARLKALDEAVKIIMSITEPGEMAPASYFAQALEDAR